MIDDNNKDVKAYSPFHLGKQKKIWNNMTEANLKNIVELLLLGLPIRGQHSNYVLKISNYYDACFKLN